MEQLNDLGIYGFEYGKISGYKNLYYLVSKEVKEYSNASFLDSRVNDIFKLFISKNLEKNGLNPSLFFEDTIIVLAHGESNKENWKIYYDKFNFYNIEEFLKKLPTDKKILLYVCNTGNYEIKNSSLKIIYPNSATGVENLKFNISSTLLELLSKK